MADQGETTRSLGAKVGVTSAAITGWCSGARPRASVTKKLADYFKISVETLTDDTKDLPAFAVEKQVAKQLGLVVDNEGEMHIADPTAPERAWRESMQTIIAESEKKLAELTELIGTLKRGLGGASMKSKKPKAKL